MILTPADRQRIRDAFRARIGNTALPSNITIDDVCTNLILAVPALLDALDAADDRIATLTAQLEADPCP